MSVRNGMIYSFSNMLPSGLSFVLFPFYAKYLGASAYGGLSTIEAFVSILSILLLLGMNTSFYVFYNSSKTDIEKNQIFTISLLYGLVILILLGFILFVNSKVKNFTDILSLNYEYNILVIIYILKIFFDYILSITNGFLRAEERPYYYLFINGLNTIIMHMTLVYLILFNDNGIESYNYALGLSAIISFMLSIILYIRLNINITKFNIEIFKKMIIFGMPLIFTGLNGWVILMSDRLFLNYFGETSDVGIYAVAYKFATFIQIALVQAFIMSWEPSIFKKFNKDKRLSYLDIKNDFKKYILIVALIYLGLILFINDIYKILFSNTDFSSGFEIVYLIAIAYFFMSLGEFQGIFLKLNKFSKHAPYIMIVATTVNLSLNYLFIPTYGIKGAAVATLIAEIASQFVLFYYARKFYKDTLELYGVYEFLIVLSLVIFSIYCFIFQPFDLLYKILIYISLLLLVVKLIFKKGYSNVFQKI